MTSPTALPSLAIGDRAPDFDLPAVDGTRLSLERVTTPLFVFVQSCNHCPYVLANVDRLKRLAAEFSGRAQFVLVNSNDSTKYPADSFEAMQAFAAEHALNIPYLHDRDQRVAIAYRTVRTPEVLVFDQQRRLAYHGRIDDSPKDPSGVKSEELRTALEALLAGAKPAEAETWAVGCTVKWLPGNAPDEPARLGRAG